MLTEPSQFGKLEMQVELQGAPRGPSIDRHTVKCGLSLACPVYARISLIGWPKSSSNRFWPGISSR